jgi:hypothetical protein
MGFSNSFNTSSVLLNWHCFLATCFNLSSCLSHAVSLISQARQRASLDFHWKLTGVFIVVTRFSLVAGVFHCREFSHRLFMSFGHSIIFVSIVPDFKKENSFDDYFRLDTFIIDRIHRGMC